MGLDPKEVEQFLSMLLDQGVEDFEGFGIKVKFRDAAPHVSEHGGVMPDPQRWRAKEGQKSQWHHPSLWGPQGKPPTFESDD